MLTMLTMPAIVRLSQLPPLGKTDGVKGDLDALTFTMGDAGWVLWEWDYETKVGFGLCDLGLGFPEIGYVNLDEVVEASRNLGLELWCHFDINGRFAGYEILSLEVPVWLVT